MNPLKHVAIIMDGNGRWGLKFKKSRNAGHKAGLKTVEKIIKETIRNNIKFLTLYAFSTENWKRPKKEVNYLFSLLENFLINRIEELHKKNIKLKVIGVKSFSKKLNNLLNFSEKKTSRNSNPLNLQGYGSSCLCSLPAPSLLGSSMIQIAFRHDGCLWFELDDQVYLVIRE